MTLPTGVVVAWGEVPAGTARRAVSRRLLAQLVPEARFVSRCPTCGGDHGRVHVEGADAAVSVSYAPGWAVVAMTRERTRLGVDTAPGGARGLERVLADATATGIDWARVEAVLKADGRGLAVDPARVEVSGPGSPWNAVIRPQTPDDAPSSIVWRGWDLDAPDGLVAAVALG
ncbi:hypothetical protein [uncultured Microbacterium sp.]|uniref:hypothetical protein n=1 Tax=uncultured Microbacterium sp. TaxID=191216 RepID=UPI0026231743|nr:hypothetical protein [uncultured Microbacterium sp.]